MANSTLVGVNTNNITLTIPVSTTSSSSNVVTNLYTAVVTDASNNYPLDINSTSYVAPDTTTTTLPPADTLKSRTASVTYETLYKNIASYPYTTDSSTTKLLTRVHTLTDGSTITVVTDMTTQDVIVQTITGNTGYSNPLIKTTKMFRDVNNKINNIVVDYTI